MMCPMSKRKTGMKTNRNEWWMIPRREVFAFSILLRNGVTGGKVTQHCNCSLRDGMEDVISDRASKTTNYKEATAQSYNPLLGL